MRTLRLGLGPEKHRDLALTFGCLIETSSEARARRQGLQLLPRRWVVERTIAWFNRNRRLAKDFEPTIASAEAWLMIASVKLLSRRLARA
jgi:transposase